MSSAHAKPARSFISSGTTFVTAFVNYELPAQDLWVTHPDHHITAQWPIYLEKKDTRF